MTDWDAYDVVLFGYPLWWREAPWVVNRFIQNNDFTGKTVIPFCTSTSNDIGDSGVHLAEMESGISMAAEDTLPMKKTL